MKQIKEIMERIQNDWNTLQNEEEIEIIRKYAKIARKFMYTFVGRLLNQKIIDVFYLRMTFVRNLYCM